MYLEHDAFIEKALQWDKNEELYLREWNARKEELDSKYEERKLLGKDKDEQTVEAWDPSKTKDNEIIEQKAMVHMTEIDLMERDWMREYDELLRKDKEAGKDFNRLAL